MKPILNLEIETLSPALNVVFVILNNTAVLLKVVVHNVVFPNTVKLLVLSSIILELLNVLVEFVKVLFELVIVKLLLLFNCKVVLLKVLVPLLIFKIDKEKMGNYNVVYNGDIGLVWNYVKHKERKDKIISLKNLAKLQVAVVPEDMIPKLKNKIIKATP